MGLSVFSGGCNTPSDPLFSPKFYEGVMCLACSIPVLAGDRRTEEGL